MKIERAKELLSGNPAHSGDELENEIAEALKLLESSPELQSWMEEQEQLDPVIAGAIRSTPVPDGLQGKLLETVGADRSVKRSRTRWFIWAGSLAALIALSAVSLRFTSPGEQFIQGMQHRVSGNSPDDFDQFRDGMAYYIRNVYFQLDHFTSSMDSIEDWLEENNAPLHEAVPAQLLALQPIGCKELSWNGHPVSLVCFHTRDGNIVHMFIMDKDAVDEAAYASLGDVMVSNELETGGWVTEDKVYVLVGSNPDVDIEFALS